MTDSILSVSISHHRAPVEVRERLTLSEDEAKSLLTRVTQEIAREAFLLSTCNRTEFYALAEPERISHERLIELLFSVKGLSDAETAEYRPYFEHTTFRDSIEHLFRVIASIDSQVIGDQQIFAQVKDAFRISTEAGAARTLFTKLSQSAFRVAKRVISETSLLTGAATISYAAVELSRKIYDDLKSRHVLIIGAGETGELAAKHFLERGIGTLTIANRTLEKARALQQRLTPDAPADRAISLDALQDALASAHVVVTALAAPEQIITRAMVARAMERRPSQSPLLLLDLSVPRAIDPTARSVANVFLKDIDDLRSMVDQNLDRRKQEIPKAEAIIREEVEAFLLTISSLEAGPAIKDLRERFEAVRREELDRHRTKVDEKSYAIMEDMTRRMMNRLLHQPTVALKQSADNIARIETVRELFGLNGAENRTEEHT